MENFEIVCRGLESPADAAFQEAMRPELQQRLLAFSVAEWEHLMRTWQLRPAAWVAQLCDTLSPAKHGPPAISILMAIALEGPADGLPLILPKLAANHALNPTERALLKLRFEQIPIPSGHHAAQQHADLLALISQPNTQPPLQEACEYAADHRTALDQSPMAACYYCQTIFARDTISEYIDRGRTALCPHCGTDAVLPSASGYDLTPATLQALNEFWFH